MQAIVKYDMQIYWTSNIYDIVSEMTKKSVIFLPRLVRLPHAQRKQKTAQKVTQQLYLIPLKTISSRPYQYNDSHN